MKPKPIHETPESAVHFNRERLKSEIAQGIHDLMEHHKLKRSELAVLLGVDKSRITHILSGCHNFELETLADLFLVLGKALHVTLGSDLDEFRLPTVEDWEVSHTQEVDQVHSTEAAHGKESNSETVPYFSAGNTNATPGSEGFFGTQDEPVSTGYRSRDANRTLRQRQGKYSPRRFADRVVFSPADPRIA